MDHISALLLKKRGFIDAVITPKKIHEHLLIHFPLFKNLKIKYRNGMVWLRGPAPLMSEVFLKKQQLIKILKQDFPQIKKIELF